MINKIKESSLNVQNVGQSLFWFKNKVINFADLQNPQKSMSIKYDKDFRTTLADGDRVEIHIFEPITDNYSWKISDWGDCKGQISLIKDSVELAIDRSKNKRVYTKMNDSYLIPTTNFSISKDRLTTNIGVRKFIL